MSDEQRWMSVPFENEARRALGLLLLCRDSGRQADADDWDAAWEQAESAMGAATGYKPPVPAPRKPRTAPAVADVLEMYRFAKSDGHESALHQAIEYALEYADDYEVPRWDADPIVKRNGWEDGRCGKCGEPLPCGDDICYCGKCSLGVTPE